MPVFTFDLHSHVNENKVTAQDYFGRAKAVGIDAIAITEHAHIRPKEAFEKLENSVPEGITLIPGCELNCGHGHLLCYGKDKGFFEISDLFLENVKFEACLDIAKQEGLLLSISHPWGFNSDSFGYTLGFEGLEELVFENDIGVEIYNGMIGSIANFIYETGWVKKPVSFLDFLEKNRVTRKTGITRLSTRLKSKIDQQRRNVVERCSKAIELASHAKFVTAGSDAHVSNRIGEGILKLKSDEPKLTNKNVLEELRKKENVIWSGPLVIEREPGVYERADKPFNNKEILQGMGYATRKLVGKVREKARIGKKEEESTQT
ncbi:MAG: PHP domain-containing protein [Candidatus Diapherotrites archaeon]|nr:PHP domain-containing protein [Candidatus Diapherotrites archaeon]